MNFTLRILGGLLFLGSLPLFAFELRYESGFPKVISFEKSAERRSEKEAIEELIHREFSDLRGLNWQLAKRQEDDTHVHLTFDLYHDKYPVFYQSLKLHYHREGYIDYLTSTLKKSFHPPEIPKRSHWDGLKDELTAVLWGGRVFSGNSIGQLGIWFDEPSSEIEWAYRIEANPNTEDLVKKGLVSIRNPKLLIEEKIIRHFWEEERASLQLKVFPRFPPTKIEPTVSTQSTSNLLNEVAWVQYNQNVGTGVLYRNVGENTVGLSEVEAASSYQVNCDGSSNACANQKVDSGNVFYHVTNYRNWLNGKSESLGSSLSFPYDPIRVIVNFMAKAIGKESALTQSNNAAYIGGTCDESQSINHCLVFLKPASDYKSLAREAMVVAHEYQHYVTDMISGINFIGSSGNFSVGDVIHEGYSDYFSASYVTESSGTSTDVLGEYSFPVNSGLRRDLTEKKVLDNDELYSSPHAPGWVWASALWELRGLIGTSFTDNIALKSLYYVSTIPGFVDTVEALIQADRVLYSGVHESTIRRLFLDERKFIGTLSGVFQDSEKKIVKMGFQGCAAISSRQNEKSWVLTLIAIVIWIGMTFGLGRLIRREA